MPTKEARGNRCHRLAGVRRIPEAQTSDPSAGERTEGVRLRYARSLLWALSYHDGLFEQPLPEHLDE